MQHREKLQLRFGFQIFGSAAAEDGESAREEDSGKDRVESRSWKARLLLPAPTSHLLLVTCFFGQVMSSRELEARRGGVAQDPLSVCWSLWWRSGNLGVRLLMRRRLDLLLLLCIRSFWQLPAICG